MYQRRQIPPMWTGVTLGCFSGLFGGFIAAAFGAGFYAGIAGEPTNPFLATTAQAVIFWVVFPVAWAIAIVLGVILSRRRVTRARAALSAPPHHDTGGVLSPDGHFWWNGYAWMPVTAPRAMSPDGRFWWDGASWQPVGSSPSKSSADSTPGTSPT